MCVFGVIACAGQALNMMVKSKYLLVDTQNYLNAEKGKFHLHLIVRDLFQLGSLLCNYSIMTMTI